MSQQIVSAITDGVLEIALNRPEKKNAVTTEMYRSLASLLVDAGNNDNVAAVLIRGQDGVFSAGNDIEDFLTSPPVSPDAPTWQFFEALMQLDKPIVDGKSGCSRVLCPTA
ncbi:enoyl-CoA hydratase-related protein [Cupriavidus necator]